VKAIKVHHIALAVTDLAAALKFFRDTLGARVIKEDISQEENRKAVFLTLGNVCLELMQPLSAEGALAKFIEKRGQGIHSLGIQVEDFDAAAAELEAEGINLVGRQEHPFKYAFTHPKNSFGVMLELSEYPEDEVNK
jgi:methylmalonyl-CoA epimerase